MRVDRIGCGRDDNCALFKPRFVERARFAPLAVHENRVPGRVVRRERIGHTALLDRLVLRHVGEDLAERYASVRFDRLARLVLFHFFRRNDL